MREYNPSMLTANPAVLSSKAGDTAGDEDEKVDSHVEANVDMDNDAFVFTSDPPPKVLITTSPQATKTTYEFCDELVPAQSLFHRRRERVSRLV
jgi:ribosome production factor 1